MPNPNKAEVSVCLYDKQYILRYDMNALAEVEELYEQPLPQFLSTLKDGISVTIIRQLLFFGLQVEHADEFPDVKSAGRGMKSISEYTGAVSRALTLAMTGKESNEKDENSVDPLPKKTGESGTGGLY
ncbi:MAG: hypothetical protein ACXADY_25930 [Candidatus Hodarchaeales archaeon]